jgi:AcrR family transcriptional regulator
MNAPTSPEPAVREAQVRRRRRGAELEAAIRAAVVELAIDAGVAGVTMQAVAARARTAKPVLYRRWPDRAALLRDTLVPLAMETIPHHDTGSYRGDMLAILRGWKAFFDSPTGVIAPAIIGAMPHDPELASAFRDGVIGWRKHAMTETISRAVSRGEVKADVRVDVARELGQALLWHRFLVTGDDIDDAFIEHVVDEVLIPYTSPTDSSSVAAAAQAFNPQSAAAPHSHRSKAPQSPP